MARKHADDAVRAEDAVRTYLVYLDDPAGVIDRQAVSEVEAEIATTSDPLEKLRLLTKLRQLNAANEEELKQAFYAHAKDWADANGIDPVSFIELGVDHATMRAAGFNDLPKAATKVAVRDRPTTGTRRARVRVEDVKTVAAKRTGEFTLAELIDSTGGSPMTVRRAVNQLVDAGDIERLGPAPSWGREGRAPIIYRRRMA